MSSAFPFGQLITFGDFSFTDNRSRLQAPTDELQVTYAPVVGRVIPVDRLGNTTASLRAVERAWEYHIIAQDLPDFRDHEGAVVEAHYNTLREKLIGARLDGTTLAVDTLTVRSLDGTTERSARCRFAKLAVKDWLYGYICVECTFLFRVEFA